MIRNLVWAGAGTMLALVAMYVWRGGTPWPSGPVVDTPAALSTVNARVPTARSEPETEGERRDDPDHLSAAPARAETVTEAAPVPKSADLGPAEPARPTVVWLAPKDEHPVSTDIPNRRANDDKGSRPAASLLDAASITCDFGPGTVAGARVGDTLSVFSGSQWQGGLMTYGSLDPSGGKARLTGTPGAVGSPTGEANVQLMVIGSRVQFMGLLPNGTYMLTTVYDELDNMDRHVALMSRHAKEGFFNYGTQQLGVCY